MDCPTEKKSFASKETAMYFVRRTSNGRCMRAYLCDQCFKWHLTSNVGGRKNPRKPK
jgi:hypothetical protein